MNRYSDEPRRGRRSRASAGIWGSPEFLFGVTRGSYRGEPARGSQGGRPMELGIPDQAPATRDPWPLRWIRHLSRRLRGQAADTAQTAATKVAPAE